MIDISFLVPLYNEEKNITPTIEVICQSAINNGLQFEIIVCDDKSSDQSLAVIKSKFSHDTRITVLENSQNVGFAKTYVKALEHAKGEYVQYISSDNDIDIENLTIILSHLHNAPIILQYCKNPCERKTYRALISRLFVIALNFINKEKLKYYNGFNIYPRLPLINLTVTEMSFAFQAEIVSKLIKAHAYKEVGVHCHFKDETSSALKVSNIVGVTNYLLKSLFNLYKRNR